VNYEQPISPNATGSNIGAAASAHEDAQSAGTVTPGADTPGVIAPPPLIYLGALGVGFGLDAAIGRGSLPSTVARPVGAGLIVAGAGLMGTFVRAFGRAQTPVDPYTPSKAIVTDGPYRLTRNPGYLGLALTYAGIAIASNAPWALVPLPVAIAVMDRGVIAREERYLERKFGVRYTDYKRRVRRWI
jgi:protein-S-isoprenylcysteine O-methyltransferase Ste14